AGSIIQGEVLKDEVPEGFPTDPERKDGASYPVTSEKEEEGVLSSIMNFLIPSARAQNDVPRQVPVGKSNGDMDKIMEQADELLQEMTDLTKNLKEGLNPQELKQTL